MPFPASTNFCGEAVAELMMLTVAWRGPKSRGVNTTWTTHECPRLRIEGWPSGKQSVFTTKSDWWPELYTIWSIETGRVPVLVTSTDLGMKKVPTCWLPSLSRVVLRVSFPAAA